MKSKKIRNFMISYCLCFENTNIDTKIEFEKKKELIETDRSQRYRKDVRKLKTYHLNETKEKTRIGSNTFVDKKTMLFDTN